MNSALPDGVISLDKPSGWTSHDAVAKMRRLAGTRRVGHLGTLDPLATGVLPLLIGRVTRLAQFFLTNEKVYKATIRFGFSTDTYDADGTAISEFREPRFSHEDLDSALAGFRGTTLQTPPAISAKKIRGTPAYKLARAHLTVELSPVEVTISHLEILSLDSERAEVIVRCSSGTYVRSIAHDLGERLGCGAHLEALRRLKTGDFSIESARTMPQLEEMASEGRLVEALIPAAVLLPHFPSEYVDSTTAGFIRQGRDFRVSPFRQIEGSRYVKAITEQGDLIAIGEARLPNVYHPMVVL